MRVKKTTGRIRHDEEVGHNLRKDFEAVLTMKSGQATGYRMVAEYQFSETIWSCR